MTPKITALEIADSRLEQTGDAMMRGDFESFMECFDIPLVIETFEGKCLFQTRREIESIFNSVREFRATNQIVEIVRENVAAEFIDHQTVAATHISRMLQRGNILFGRPYPAYSILKFIGGDWKIQFCQYAVDDPNKLNAALTANKEKAPLI